MPPCSPSSLWQKILACRRFAAEGGEDFAGDVAGIGVGGEEDVGGSDLFGLGGAFHWGVGTEFGYFLRVLVSNIQRRPDRAGSDAVYANSLFDKILRERFRECVDRAFGRGLIDQSLAAFQAGDRAGVDDRRAFLQVL